DVDASHVRQVQVEQDQHRAMSAVLTRAVVAQQVAQAVGAVAERVDLVVDPGTADIALDQPGMALVVLDHDDRYRTCVHGSTSFMGLMFLAPAAARAGRSGRSSRGRART